MRGTLWLHCWTNKTYYTINLLQMTVTEFIKERWRFVIINFMKKKNFVTWMDFILTDKLPNKDADEMMFKEHTPPGLTVCFAILEHVDQAWVFHLYNGLHVFGDELPFHYLDNGLLCRFIQAMHHSLNLLIDPSFHLLYVHTGTVFCKELLALHLSVNKKHSWAVNNFSYLAYSMCCVVNPFSKIFSKSSVLTMYFNYMVPRRGDTAKTTTNRCPKIWDPINSQENDSQTWKNSADISKNGASKSSS